MRAIEKLIEREQEDFGRALFDTVTKEYIDQQNITPPHYDETLPLNMNIVSDSSGLMTVDVQSSELQWNGASEVQWTGGTAGNIDFIAGTDGEITFITDDLSIKLTEIVALKGEIDQLRGQVLTLLGEKFDREVLPNAAPITVNPDFDRARSLVIL
ncbi:hypothetical protein LCGC14_0890210 [marine sediment metagenome]|uniref:Uncharacterized protein n=1 Tax=marine sediment metagenome TaxID=412755 RepID=A0A0F9S6G7_9ZZZZ